MSRPKPFTGHIKDALHTYQARGKHTKTPNLWTSEALLTAAENADNAMKSMAVLCKHLPKSFHPLIRFAQPKTTWYLNVEKGVTATQLNMLLDDLLVRIAKDIGYAPRLRVMVQPARWAQTGFPLSYPEKTRETLPNAAESEAIIADFLSVVVKFFHTDFKRFS